MSALTTLIHEYLDFVFSSYPIEATRLGVHEYDQTLGDYTPDAIAERAQRRSAFLQRFRAIDPATLSADEQLDWRLVCIDIETTLRRHEDLHVEERAPYWYVERLDSALSTLLQSSAASLEIAQKLEARLHDTPAYLRQVQQNLTAGTPALHREMGIAAAAGLEHFLSESIPAFARDLPGLVEAMLSIAAANARSALGEFVRHLQERLHPAGRFACGPEHFDFLLRHFHLLDLDHRALHEIYPGHHTQKTHHKLATAAHPMRRYFSSPLFVEGWGLYTEDLLEESGFMIDPAVRLFKLRNALWRSARVVVDSGLHTRGMSFDAAVDLMCDAVKLDRRMAAGEVRRYTTFNNSTYPSAYLLGKLAIQKLRAQWQAQEGGASTLKTFHDRLLSYGSPPVQLVAERMVGKTE